MTDYDKLNAELDAKIDATVANVSAGIEQLKADNADMLAEMKAAAGYLRNARIDLETGATKATAIRTIDGGLKRLEAAIEARA